MHVRGSRQIEKLSSNYQVEANLKGSRIYQGFIGQTESFSMDQESVEKLLRESLEILMDQDCDNFCRDKKKKGLDG